MRPNLGDDWTHSHTTRVRLISESTFTVRGHGVHSVYEEHAQAISMMDDFQLVSGVRSLSPRVILHSHTIGPIAVARILIHRGFKIITAHITPTSLLESIRFARPFLGLVSRYMRFVYNRADAIIAVSESAAAELSGLKVRRPIFISYDAIDDYPIHALLSQRAELRRSFGWSDRVVVLSVGQLQPRKGIAEFIESASALPDLYFIWIGGMPFGILSAQRGRILQACSKAPDNVKFLGSMPRRDIYRYYAAADVFFLPSHQETFGLATLEAATAGLPLVLRDLDCYREWLGDAYMSGKTTRDYIYLLQRLSNIALRISLGERAARAASKHGREALIKGLRDMYELACKHAA